MLDARRAERNYFLLRDPEYLRANRESLARATEAVGKIRDLEPEEQSATQQALEKSTLYGRQFSDAVSQAEKPGGTPIERTQEVVRAYERDLNDLLKHARRKTRTQLIEDLRSQVNSLRCPDRQDNGGRRSNITAGHAWSPGLKPAGAATSVRTGRPKLGSCSTRSQERPISPLSCGMGARYSFWTYHSAEHLDQLCAASPSGETLA